jgi:hypothetical protein
MLGEAAADARRVAGEAHYTGCHVHQESETLELWLCSAPQEVLQELEAIRPRVYVIHNDAAHPVSELFKVQKSIDLAAVTSQGITVTGFGPRNDGYIWVEVITDLVAARAWFEGEYGPDLFRFYAPEHTVVALVQLKCPETGEPIDVWRHRVGAPITADAFSRMIPCPHCSGSHQWTSGDRGLAAMALQGSPDSTRVLVEYTPEGSVATALP